MALLYGRAGRLTAQNGGLRQFAVDFYNGDSLSGWTTSKRGIIGSAVNAQGQGLWIGFQNSRPLVSFGPARRECRAMSRFLGRDYEVLDICYSFVVNLGFFALFSERRQILLFIIYYIFTQTYST